MFEIIQGVDIGQGAGNAFGGGIYSASCQLGFSNGPTTISLGVVKENGDYPNITTDASSTYYNINLNGVQYPKMYLTSYRKTRNDSSRLLTLNFIDSSVFLDKIQIGLLNRHGRDNVETNLVQSSFSVRCMSCTEGGVSDVSGYAKRYLDEIPLNGGSYHEKDPDGGGFIILGKEYFTETNCEIPNVDYNFTDFCSALTAFGLEHDLEQFDLNGFYRQQYIGSAREVLNSWGSDFGFEFFWNGTGIQGIDLKIPVDLSEVETFSETNDYVVSSEIGESLENSYTQKLVARYLQPSETKEYNNTYYYRSEGRQILLEDILENGGQAGRYGEVLYTSVALAKYDGALREIYLGSRISDYGETGVLEAFGATSLLYLNGTSTQRGGSTDYFNLKAGLLATNVEIQEIIKNNYSTSQINSWLNPDNWEIYLVQLREDRKQKIQNWDASAASFIGQYYYYTSPPGITSFGCPVSNDLFVYYTYSSNWSTTPQSSTYGNDAMPFKDLLINPITDTPLNSAGVLGNLPIFQMNDNAWDLQTEDYEKDKGKDKTYDALKPLFVSYEDFPSTIEKTSVEFLNEVRKTMGQATLNASRSQLETLLRAALNEKDEDNAPKLGYIMIPKYKALRAESITSIPLFSSLGFGLVNNAVYDRVTTRNSDDSLANNCKTFCESDIVSEICNCGSTYTPVPYFQNLRSNFFHILHPNGSNSAITFPVNANCWGFLGHERSFKTTYPPIKKIYGKPPVNAGNVLSTKVIDYDMTPELSAIFDNNDNINEYIYSPTTEQIMTAADFYEELSNLNDITIPPQKNVNITVAKTKLSTLGLDISQEAGLTNMSISMGTQGVTSDLSFSTRPPFIPKPDVYFQKIKYRLKP